MRPGEHPSHAAHGGEASHANEGDHGTVRRTGPLPGLAMADAGLRLEADPTIVSVGQENRLAFRVVRGRETVTSFDELHERRMHLIVVRRDLTGFQHLHPEMDEDGTWRTNLVLPAAGVWRAFADFATGGVPTTLGVDLFVDGDFRSERLPEPNTIARAADDVVALVPSEGVLRFTLQRDGEPVRVQPYLGALGHLVVLRLGDLAFLHVHPVDNDDIAFAVSYPSEAIYRLFLQYSVNDMVRTAAFTVNTRRV